MEDNQIPEEDSFPEIPAIADASENPDPSQAVDGMLSAALNEEPTPLVTEESKVYAAPLSYGVEYPNFSILVKHIPESVKNALVASFEQNSFGCSVQDVVGQISQGRIHLWKLTEYQVAALLQELHRFSLVAEVHKVWDESATPQEPGNAEDFLNASVVQAPEGAPSVELLADHNEVLLVTMAELPGYNVQSTIGPVYAHKSLARRFFRDQDSRETLEKELRKLNKGRKDGMLAAILPQSAVEKTFRALFSDLRKAALAQGANAVVDIRIACFPESSHLDPELEQIRMVLSGTASHLEKTTL